MEVETGASWQSTSQRDVFLLVFAAQTHGFHGGVRLRARMTMDGATVELV